MSNIIETRALTRRFGSLTAVSNLDLAVPEGAVYGFLGPNGAGKTTTIRILLGLIRPDAGEVRLFDRPLCADRRAALRRVGALVENPSIYPHLTGRENLEITRRLRRAAPRRIDQALEIVGLNGAANRRVGGYSQGMRQRLGLALALLGEVNLLILDEPTNGLDPAGIREMRDLIRRLAAEQGMTIFLSSHLLGEVEQVATHLGIVREGRLLFQGRLSDLQAQLRGSLRLGVSEPARAEDILTRAGIQPLPGEGNSILIAIGSCADAGSSADGISQAADGSAADPREEAGRINNLLVAAGLQVYHLSLEQPSLEDIFFKLTEAGDPSALPGDLPGPDGRPSGPDGRPSDGLRRALAPLAERNLP